MKPKNTVRRLLLCIFLVFLYNIRFSEQTQQQHNNIDFLFQRRIQEQQQDVVHLCGTESPSRETMQEIETQFQEYIQILESSNQTTQEENNTTITIPVVVTILEHRSIPNSFIENHEIERQIETLNNAFAGTPGLLYPYDCAGDLLDEQYTHTGIQFELQNIHHRTVCDTNSVNNLQKDSEIEFEMKERYRQGDCSTLNIYITNLSGFLGWASFPSQCNENNMGNDGVMIHRDTLPSGDRVNYNEGDILVHQVGHWLGLYHTFEHQQQLTNDGDACDEQGDSVHDTPPTLIPTIGCPAQKDTCGSDNLPDPIHNYMDFSDNCCMYQFTEGQAQRMRYFYDYRVNNIPTTIYSEITTASVLEHDSDTQKTGPHDVGFCHPFCRGDFLFSSTTACMLPLCSHCEMCI